MIKAFENIDRSKLSPMMQHYLQTREENEGIIVFYRLGDFYEMFFDDAETVSRELEITLTGKDCGLEERAPMCGIPYHAADTYIARLIQKGYKVAICEQVEDPKKAKGLVQRKVIKIITPGTTMTEGTLTEDENNFICSIILRDGKYGIATADISTGQFMVTEVDQASKVLDEITKFEPSEIVTLEGQDLFPEDDLSTETYNMLLQKLNIMVSPVSKSDFELKSSIERIEKQFHTSGVEGLGLKDLDAGIMAAGGLICYLLDTQMSEMEQLNSLKVYYVSKFMVIDSATRRNLELTETMRDKQRVGSLLWVLDHTKTAMGARRLRNFVEMPLMDLKAIEARYDAIDALNRRVMDRDEVMEYMNSIYDLERLMTKISIKTAGPHDLLSFRNSLKYLPFIHNLIHGFGSSIFETMDAEMDDLQDLYHLIDNAISEDAPITIREGGIFRPGFSQEIDDFKEAKIASKDKLNEIEARERENTGIKNLRIKFNRVYGYFFEVTNSFQNLVPDYFIRKQTLTNAERYTTTELQSLSDIILGSEDKLFNLEYEEYCKLRDFLASQTTRVQRTAENIAEIDALCSLSYIAVKYNYIRPSLNQNGVIDIREGRHPVVERMMNSGTFIPNDTVLDSSANRIMIITGPNMAGKSTYMRQTALIALMAQCGSFVPATSANICISDRIFTRVGASDDLAQGQSTFMVEMSEVSNILRNATKNSLIIMDEIGRGTSTFDGLSIAWAVVEYIADPDAVGAKTLFATHYHELTELEGKLSSVNNYCIAIKQTKDSLVFLRKIVPGGADRSYGIEVAELAGLPKPVIDRAKDIANQLAEDDITGNARDIEAKTVHKEEPVKRSKKGEAEGQMCLFGSTEDMTIVAELKALDLNNMTPVKAMLYLQELKDRLG
ncbi:MAG: DNA mismatch repair protein MutS [Lachnospiraceae bacterium]|nr:DNA mismatch repair protein MutS [Lachnospiraceae bacterium]